MKRDDPETYARPPAAAPRHAMPAIPGKPKWPGGRHPLARLHLHEAWGELVDDAHWHGDWRDSDDIDRIVELAVAKGALPRRLAKRMKRVTRALRRFEELRRELVESDDAMFELYLVAERKALARARRTGMYDPEGLDREERLLNAK